MRILVHEFFSGGGLAGRNAPSALVREGSAMLAALVVDLAAIGRHQIVTTADSRFPFAAPAGVEVVELSSRRIAPADALIDSVDAVWLIAPETNRCLERLAARVERRGKALLGCGAVAIGAASDKAALPRRLARHGVSHPETLVLRRPDLDCQRAARQIGYPLVVKPGRGAGCSGVSLARNMREMREALDTARHAGGAGPLLLQRYVAGAAASVALLSNGRRAVPLAVNGQTVRVSRPFWYCGGTTPLEHPLAGRALEAAVRTCGAFPGLYGYVGVDLVLTESEAIVIELNPRLTTAYLGVRSALESNIAALALDACAGNLAPPRAPRRRVRFTAAGRIVSTTDLEPPVPR
jgi:predicted ATP-grasp superfamily ATP-dependent carboligase